MTLADFVEGKMGVKRDCEVVVRAWERWAAKEVEGEATRGWEGERENGGDEDHRWTRGKKKSGGKRDK